MSITLHGLLSFLKVFCVLFLTYISFGFGLQLT